MTDLVTLDIRDDIATLTMDDGKANALSLAMSRAIDGALDRAAKEARVVVLRGRPGVFCGGFDLKVIRGDDEGARKAMRDAGMALKNRLYMLPQPLILACTGHGVAAGAIILLTGDVRIGVRGAFKVGLNEVAIGLTLPQAGLELARERLTPNALTMATVLAKLYDPIGAVEAGYLDSAIDADAFDDAVRTAAQSLVELDPAAFAETKRRLRQPMLDRLKSPPA